MEENHIPSRPHSRQEYTNPTFNDSHHVERSKSDQSVERSAKAPPTTTINPDKTGVMSQRQEPAYADPPTLLIGHHTEENSAVSSTERQQRPKFTFHQKITIVSALLAALSTWLTFSIIAVFYPVEANARGVTNTVTGLVFSSVAFASWIGSPLWGKMLPVLGARFTFLAGAFVNGGCNVLFGFVVEMPTKATFIAFSLVIRILEGLGTSACYTAASAIVAHTFPENVGTAVSMIEMMCGFSLAIGPAIGGLLYNVGGFKLPFFVLGGMVLLICGINFFLMPEHGSTDKKPGSVTQVLKIPAVWVALFAVFAGGFGISYLDPTLSPHLKEMNFTVVETSLMFGSLGVLYALTSVLWGYVADKKKTTRIMMIMGAFGSAVFFLLVGPSPLLNIHPSKLFIILIIPLGSLSLALTTMPTFVDMFITAEWYGIPGDLGLTGIISGLWNSALSIGTMTGPLVAGALTDHFEFNYAATITAGAYIVVVIFLGLFGVWDYRCGKGRRVPRARLVLESNTIHDERRPLLSNDVKT